MKAYLDIVRNILDRGIWKVPVRHNPDGTAVELANDTIGLPNQIFSHDMSEGFPLLTTKRVAFKTLCTELEGFIKGITDKKWYQMRGCKIWDEWANPQAVRATWEEQERKLEDWIDSEPCTFEQARLGLQYAESDLGPIYGSQWRAFNKTYPGQSEDDGDFHSSVDQLKRIVDTLHKNPLDRRMVCSAWNPNQIHMMALPPCHYAWNVTVYGDRLHLMWAQRSCDLMLGVPFNIASYAMLLTLLARESGFKPGNLTGVLVDCHIYRNHIDGAKLQVEREPTSLPTVEILDRDGGFSIFNWQATDVKLNDYSPQGKIDFGGVTV